MANSKTVSYRDKEITLIGTVPASYESAELVKQTIERLLPDTVCIELDKERYKNLQNPKAWENTNVADIIKEKKTGLLLASILLSSYQKQAVKKFDTVPGQEMLQAIQCAKSHSCGVVFADRSIQTTFLRVWRKLSLWKKCRLLSGLFIAGQENTEAADLDRLMEKDGLEAEIVRIGEEFPEISEILINERDQYLAYKIKTAPGKKIVAVVGAAHVSRIERQILQQQDQDIEGLTSIPKQKRFFQVLAWSIPMSVFLLIVCGFISNYQTGLQQLKSWVLWNGTLAGLFTAALLGHPFSILTAFISAPITSLNPFLACGWFVGLVEASIRKPTVDDINRVPEDIFHISRFLKNRFLKAMAIVISANAGSVLGTIIAGTDILKTLF